MNLFINIPNSNHDAVDNALNRLADLYPLKYAELLQQERFQGLANFIVKCHPNTWTKIANIKLFRELSGLGLADSKRMIETAYEHAQVKRDREALSAALKDAPPEDDDLPF
jgi:ribosomal protein L7/L12